MQFSIHYLLYNLILAIHQQITVFDLMTVEESKKQSRYLGLASDALNSSGSTAVQLGKRMTEFPTTTVILFF